VRLCLAIRSLGLVALIMLWDADGGADEPGRPAPAATAGRDLYADPAIGDDRADGLAPGPRGASGPVRTIARGIKLAMPGDTVHLAPVTFRESVIFHDRHGEPGRPITLDGHGATIEGSDPLNPADWEQISPGLYRNDRLVRPDLLTRDNAIIGRWFFLFDGRMNHMGRTSKGPSRPLKRPEDLAPGEWTIVPGDHAFYIRIDPSRTLADCKIAAPLRSSAVVVSGHCSHIIVRNLTGTHVQNDGYNIHGVTRDAEFRDIAAIECGDDGFSAHDDCQVRVDGFRSVGNSTGITNTGHSRSENRRVWIQDCLGFDLYVFDEGYRDEDPRGSNRHSVVDSVIVSSAAKCVVVDGSRGLGDPCTLQLDSVLIRRVGGPSEILVAKNSTLVADRVAAFDVGLVAGGGAVEWRHSLIGGRNAPGITLSPGVAWQADHNVYGLSALRWGGVSYEAARFDEYRRASGQDGHSRWKSSSIEEGTLRDAEAGVDASRLPSR
jgi:hypothetical protein